VSTDRRSIGYGLSLFRKLEKVGREGVKKKNEDEE